MLHYLDWLDHRVFELVQLYLRSDVLDPVFLALRDKHFWIPLYIFLLSWLMLQYGRNSWKLILAALTLIAITDQLNSAVIKDVFKRDRPCREMYFKEQFTPVVDCSGGYSFPSSHATNHMGLSSLLFFSCRMAMKKWRWLLLFWAVLVGFSQVYIGVHFPADVSGGWIEGFTLGFLMYHTLRYFLHWNEKEMLLPVESGNEFSKFS